MKSIGLFGGTFDPIHIGHLILARDAREQLGLECVIFLPALISPHKLARPPAPAGARLGMLEAALAGEEGFAIDTRELHRGGPSYAIDTAREYASEFPGAKLYYLVGDDNVADLDTWKEIDALREILEFVIMTRESSLSAAVVFRQIEISSTEIRNRIASGLPIRYMVPDPVGTILSRLGLYTHD